VIWQGTVLKNNATRNGLDTDDKDMDDFYLPPCQRNGREKWITDLISRIQKNTLWLNLNNNWQLFWTNTNEMKRTPQWKPLDVFSSSGFYYSDDGHIYGR
jgi:hypothetical protein